MPEDSESHTKKLYGGIGMKVLLVFCFLIILLISNLHAEEHEQQAKEVVITATKTEMELEDVPSSVTVITKEEIEAKGAERLSDILDFAPGVYQSTYMGREKSVVSVRGFRSDHSLILIDGRRLTGEGSHAYEIDRITLENVERIEIVRGPVSSLYGTDALGGVINLITKKPDKLSFIFTPEFGVYEGGKGMQRAYSMRLDGGKIGNLSFSLSGSLLNRSAIFRADLSNPQGDAEHKNLALRIAYDLTKETRITADASYTKEDSVDNTVSGTNVSKGIDDNERYNISLEIAHKSPALDYLLRAYTSVYSKDFESRVYQTNILQNFTEADRQTSVIEGRLSKELFTNHLFTMGGEYRHESFKGTRVRTGKGLFTVTREGVTLTGSEAKINYWAWYIQDEWQALEKLLIIPAVRYDDSDKFENEITPKIGFTYKVLPNLRFKANYGHGFKTPNPGHLYLDHRHFGPRYRVLGNPDIKSEKSKSYEATIEGEVGIFSGRVAYFYNDVKDLIDTVIVTCPPDTGTGWRCYQYMNISKAEIQGIELEAGAKLTEQLGIKASYSYLDAKDKNLNQRLENRPKNKVIAKGAYQNKSFGLKANIWWEYINGLLWQRTPSIEKDYGLWYVNVSKEITKNMEFYAGVDNIFNKKDNDIPIIGSYYHAGLKMKF